MANDFFLSKEGFAKLKKELEDLKGPTRSRIAEAIAEAKSHGDLRENAAYHEARLNQQRNESRIADLEKLVTYAKIVERPEGAGESAHLGSVVVLEDLEFSEVFEITLVGSFEADPQNNLISIASPLGSAVIGKLIGDQIEVDAPGGIQSYKINAIRID